MLRVPNAAACCATASTLVQARRCSTAAAQPRTGAALPPFSRASRTHDIPTSGGVTINAVKGGSGPPLLLLHGAPLTLYTWRDVAPRLAEDYTVVAADLRGYGDSSKPQGLPDHSNYSKRAMAQDQVDVMRHFGFERFAVVGQDRGGRVAHRMALDHPGQGHEGRADRHRADVLPLHAREHRLRAGVLSLVQLSARRAGARERAAGAARKRRPAASNRRRKPSTGAANGTPEGVHGMCEDYRAGASIDLQHDAADLDTKIRCPLHVLWADNGAMDRLYDVLAIWRERAAHRHGQGHAGRPQHAGRRAGRGARGAQELPARLAETTGGHAILAGKRRAGRHPSKALFPTADRRPSIARPPQRRRVMTRSSRLANLGPTRGRRPSGSAACRKGGGRTEATSHRDGAGRRGHPRRAYAGRKERRRCGVGQARLWISRHTRNCGS